MDTSSNRPNMPRTLFLPVGFIDNEIISTPLESNAWLTPFSFKPTLILIGHDETILIIINSFNCCFTIGFLYFSCDGCLQDIGVTLSSATSFYCDGCSTIQIAYNDIFFISRLNSWDRVSFCSSSLLIFFRVLCSFTPCHLEIYLPTCFLLNLIFQDNFAIMCPNSRCAITNQLEFEGGCLIMLSLDLSTFWTIALTLFYDWIMYHWF